MSLLMDALRKAEGAKRPSGERTDVAPHINGLGKLELEPLTTATDATPASPLPALAQHLDLPSADLGKTPNARPNESATPPPSTQRPASLARPTAQTSRYEELERNAARNILALQQAQQARAVRWLFLGLLAITLLGIGGYFWWQIQSVAKVSFVRPAPPAPVLTASPPTPAEPIATLTQLPTLIADLVPPSVAQAQTQPEGTARNTSPQPPSERPDIPIRLSTRQPKANPTLARAYQALQAEQLNDARRDYEQVLRGEAKNMDALLGLATLAARQGRADDATALYLRALEADPKEVNALAGLINLQGLADPGLSESRLKTLLANQPDSSALNFALGNLLAHQNRWSDAQQAYFRAYTTEANNADYVYNLAVSLDHLHQNKLAVQYYQSALNAAEAHPSAFDKERVKQRLLELQP